MKHSFSTVELKESCEMFDVFNLIQFIYHNKNNLKALFFCKVNSSHNYSENTCNSVGLYREPNKPPLGKQ